MRDLRYLESIDKFSEYAYLALADHFASREDFLEYFGSIPSDHQKNLFLRTASFYLFLVKRGDWVVNVPGSNEVVDYLTNTYKYVAIFSLIESLADTSFIDLFSFLIRRKSKVEFPIQRKDTLEEHYRRYKDEFGSIQRCIDFFRSLSPERQTDLISRLEVKGTKPTIENLVKYLYELRSKFVHEAQLVLHMSNGTSISRSGEKMVVCRLSIKDAMTFFEEGLIVHFRRTGT